MKSLHRTIHKIGGGLDESNPRDKGQSDITMSFAYEVRKTFEYQRLKREFSFDSENKIAYYYLVLDFIHD
ncbi:hypothetical protein [Leeuwenhoekiella marinoflava]|uniref:hypothetical protein n=1 Tax=Leeuwenhoekiella marinoflava TaxID=988 RepID=UPI0011149429|nr:hypothetical protein [Leeuwenhoekiella marinoflava]